MAYYRRFRGIRKFIRRIKFRRVPVGLRRRYGRRRF